MRINTNIASLTAQEAASNTNKALSASLEKLGSGLRINKAADDASGMSIADKLRTQASSIGQGISNANSASALIQIADKAMAEQSNILDIVKTKLIQASTSTTSTEGRESIRKDIVKLLEQFDSIAGQTNYNGTTLLQKSSTDTARPDEFTFQLGEEADFNVSMTASKASNTDGLGGGSNDIDTQAINVAAVDPVTGASTTSGNNIAVAGSQTFSGTSNIILEDVDLAADGTEAAGGVVPMDINVSGKLGQVEATNDVTFDASNQTQAIKDSLAALSLAYANAGGSELVDNGDETFTITGGEIVDFGELDFSSVKVTSAAVAEQLTFNLDEALDTTITISDNNTGTDLPLTGQINVSSLTGGLTGGSLLSDIKDVAANGLTADIANDFMQTIDEALSQLNTNRSDFGSTQNQLESSIRNMQTTQTNLKAAESVIRDVDYAAESANFNKQNIISQAGTYAMSQANNVQQNIMKLLQ